MAAGQRSEHCVGYCEIVRTLISATTNTVNFTHDTKTTTATVVGSTATTATCLDLLISDTTDTVTITTIRCYAYCVLVFTQCCLSLHRLRHHSMQKNYGAYRGIVFHTVLPELAQAQAAQYDKTMAHTAS